MLTAASLKNVSDDSIFITWYTFLSRCSCHGLFQSDDFFFCFSSFTFLFFFFVFFYLVIYSSVVPITHIHLTCYFFVFSGWGSRLCATGRDGGEGGHTDPAKCKRRSGPDSDACQHSGHLRHQLMHSLSKARHRIQECIIAILHK